MGMLEPTLGVNYDFVVRAYAVCTLICAALYAAWVIWQVCEGYWLVFVPFAPCLVWGLWMRRKWVALGWDKRDALAEFLVAEELEKTQRADAQAKASQAAAAEATEAEEAEEVEKAEAAKKTD
jgi:hypothetical protein